MMYEYLKFWIKSNSKLVTIQFDLKPIQLFKIFEYLFKSNMYKEGTVSLKENVAVCNTMVLTLFEAFTLGLYGPPSTGRT